MQEETKMMNEKEFEELKEMDYEAWKDAKDFHRTIKKIDNLF